MSTLCTISHRIFFRSANGDFDSSTGEVNSFDTPRHLNVGNDGRYRARAKRKVTGEVSLYRRLPSGFLCEGVHVEGRNLSIAHTNSENKLEESWGSCRLFDANFS